MHVGGGSRDQDCLVGGRGTFGVRGLLRVVYSEGVGGAVMTALAEVSAPAIAHCFFPGDPDLCALTVHATRIYMLSFLLCGFNMFTSAWFTALNNGVVSAVAAFVRTLVFEMSVVMILPSIVGIEGIWYSVDVAEVLAFVMSVILILCFRRRYGY